jgi:hypothetical protein
MSAEDRIETFIHTTETAEGSETWKCAFCGVPTNEHRVIDSIVERVMAGDSIAETVADYGERDCYNEHTVWLMVTAVYSARLGTTRKRDLYDRRMAEWEAFVEREGATPPATRPLPQDRFRETLAHIRDADRYATHEGSQAFADRLQAEARDAL